jgi:3'-phosphoadenosine 5'-phosphosulfate sulfotransferase (PAPS reductase)/FAD synthetase
MDQLLEQSKEIVERAIIEFKPAKIVVMFSGGDDSRTVLEVAKHLKIPVHYIVHGVTNTGIKQTTEYARKTACEFDLPYLEANAGTKYEDYVLRKGFFGKGVYPAHMFAYHVLKLQHFEKALRSIRDNTRQNVLLINGARQQESRNRSTNMVNPIRQDKRNIWVNLIHYWNKVDCLDFMRDNQVKRNPVSELMHRSGECLCGTTQSLDVRKEASYWYPEWGRWIDDLEKRVFANGFKWGWGETMPPEFVARKRRERAIKAGQQEFAFMPMCQTCIALSDDTPTSEDIDKWIEPQVIKE